MKYEIISDLWTDGAGTWFGWYRSDGRLTIATLTEEDALEWFLEKKKPLPESIRERLAGIENEFGPISP